MMETIAEQAAAFKRATAECGTLKPYSVGTKWGEGWLGRSKYWVAGPYGSIHSDEFASRKQVQLLVDLMNTAHAIGVAVGIGIGPEPKP